MFKLAGFGASGIMDSQASMRVSSTLPIRLSRVTFVREKPGDDEREWPLGYEGGVLPELKMASVSAAPRNFTSGFGAAEAAWLALTPPYGFDVKQRGAVSRGQTGKLRSGRGPRPSLCSQLLTCGCEWRDVSSRCLCLHPASCPQLPGLSGWKVRLGPGCPDIRLALSLSGGLAQPRGRLLQLPLQALHGHTRVNSLCWSPVPSWWNYTLVEKMNEHK